MARSEEPSLLVAVALARKPDALLLSVDLVDSLDFLGQLFRDTLLEAFAPLYLLVQLLLLGILFQSLDLPIVVNLLRAHVETIPNVLVFLGPGPLH